MKFKISYRAECGCLMRYDMTLTPIYRKLAIKRVDCIISDDPEDNTEVIELQPTCQLHVREANEHPNPPRT